MCNSYLMNHEKFDRKRLIFDKTIYLIFYETFSKINIKFL